MPCFLPLACRLVLTFGPRRCRKTLLALPLLGFTRGLAPPDLFGPCGLALCLVPLSRELALLLVVPMPLHSFDIAKDVFTVYPAETHDDGICCPADQRQFQ